MFVDRDRELTALTRRLTGPGFELIIVYGRRRIGKTRLVLEALKRTGVKHVYYQAVDSGNIGYFKRIAGNLEPKLRYVVDDWEAVLSFLEDYVIVLDEFPYIVEEDPGVTARLQRLIDTRLEKTNTKIVLLGSSISMMKKELLSYGSPLHGRRTASIRLGPMDVFDASGFHPGAGWEEMVEIYGFAGGIPLYHSRIGGERFWDWLSRELSRPDTWIVDEAEIILRTEFREPRTYMRILEAIAHGRREPKEIREYTGLKGTDLSPYLRNLVEVGLVRRVQPVTERGKTRKTQYRIGDWFTAFWLRYIQPNLSLLNEGVDIVEKIAGDYNQYLGMVFEDVARQFLSRMNLLGRLPIRYRVIGPWWHRDREVDLLALNPEEKEALLVEVKWKKLSRRDTYKIIGRLEEIADAIPAIDGYAKHYAIVAREAPEMGDDLLVWSLRDFDTITNNPKGESTREEDWMAKEEIDQT